MIGEGLQAAGFISKREKQRLDSTHVVAAVARLSGLAQSKWTTNRRPDLSIIAPGQCAARMPGTGPLRRSSVLARKKAIVGKSLVEAERLQRPSVVFVSYELHALKLLLLGKFGGGQVAQGAMRPALIILDSPLFDNDPGFQQRAKHFPVETFVA